MDALRTRRLPGVTFRTEVPPAPDALPRMDVAGFVGLAARGPVGVPVPVEDPGQYRDVFGPALPLAWDAEAGRTATAFLTPSVEAFFRNGGRRCWVVREARGAVTSRFPLPTLLDAATGRPATARARAAGSWADALRLGTVLDARVLGAEAPRRHPATGEITLGIIDAEPVRPADVLRIRVRDGAADRTLVAPVVSVRAGGGARRVTLGAGRLFEGGEPAGLPAWAQVSVFGPDGEVRTTRTARLTVSDGTYALQYASSRLAIAPGTVLRAVPDAGPLAGREVWLATSEVEPTVLPNGTRAERALATDALWPLDTSTAALDAFLAAAASGTVAVEKLAVDLVVWEGEEVAARLGGLGLAESLAETGTPERRAARFWADLPTDEALFQLVDGQHVPPVADLDRAAATPRFPVAGPEAPVALYVPLGMPPAPDAAAALAPTEADPATTLERDGLASFSPRWFLDDALADRGVRALPAAAFDALYADAPTLAAQRTAHPLAGLHALWPLDEITVLAAPDAVQPGWRLETVERPDPLGAPSRLRAEALAAAGGFRITWRRVLDAGGEYELAVSTDPDVASASVLYRGTATHAYLYVGEEGPCGVDLGCEAPRYLRVRARVGGRIGPWSATIRLDPAPAGFRACERPLEAPALRLRQPLAALTWPAVDGADRYVVEASQDPAFGIAETLGTTTERRFDLGVLPDVVTYYRVRAERDGLGEAPEVGPWSDTEVHLPTVPSRWTMRTPEDYDADAAAADLLAFHRGALRFCAARADATALLTLPAHYRADQAAAHAAALTPDPADDADAPAPASGPVLPLSLDEEWALSYGALYHPWLGVRDATARVQPVRFLPPDGAVAGMTAARAIDRGAWVAPANVALRDVVALEPALDEVAWARLLYGGVNLVRPLPRGVAPLSAETLASGALRPLNVRRLLILLRRLALREGRRFTFDSNSAALRRRITVAFEGLLTGMFERGAFAGSKPAEAFQVRADDAVNPSESVDRGRLLVELRVAPSQPLAFLTVHLVQLDGVGLTTVEA